jgi:hypothetical protein
VDDKREGNLDTKGKIQQGAQRTVKFSLETLPQEAKLNVLEGVEDISGGDRLLSGINGAFVCAELRVVHAMSVKSTHLTAPYETSLS